MKTKKEIHQELTKQIDYRKQLTKQIERNLVDEDDKINPMWERIRKHVDTRILALKWVLKLDK